MTEKTKTSQDPQPGEAAVADLAKDTKALALVRDGIAKVKAGTISLSDLMGTVVGEGATEVASKKPPVPKALTEAEQKAIERLPKVYGSVIVTADRALTKKEAAALVEERAVVDTVLNVLKKRKEESLREVFANHLDNLLSKDEKQAARKDAKGHYAVKQEAPVDGTGQKIQRSVSGGKPRLDIAHIEDLYEQGKIDRKTYLAITRKPDNPRVLDEAGLHAAIQKNPALFFLMASVAQPTTPITTIKVVKDS